MKYYIIAGEASGDLHASNLMKALREEDPEATFRCWGGDLMEAVGGTLVKHYRDLAFMGFLEVLANLRTILKNLRWCKQDLLAHQPHALILVDYPGFNLRIAAFAKQQGIPVHYYISPQIWAWKESRVHQIKRIVDTMYVILPFERDFYEEKHHMPVCYVGHPLLDVIETRPPTNEQAFRKKHQLGNKPIIALLPGSRKQEIKTILSVMLSVVEKFKDHQFVIAGSPSQEYTFYQPFIANDDVRFVSNETYNLLSIATAALVTSGTATLETALFNVPEIVCYKTNWLSYQIAKCLIKLPFISLVNLIVDKEIVTELVQNAFSPKRLEEELQKLLTPAHREQLLQQYAELRKNLGKSGASQRTASFIVKSLKGL